MTAVGPERSSRRLAVVCAFLLCSVLPAATGATANTWQSDERDRFCTKEDFDGCEREFQTNAMALVEHEASSRFNAWCAVLQSHESCLKTVLRACRQDGYIKLSSSISATLTEVVNRGCSHRGPPFHGNCNVKHAATASEHGRQSQQTTLLKMAESCLKQQQQPRLDGSLDTLLRQLERLTRDMQHLYNRLPQDVEYEDGVDDSEDVDWQNESDARDDSFSL